ELALQHNQLVRRPGDVAGAAGTGAGTVDRRMHRGRDLRMLAKAEIVVAAPDGDFPRRVAGCRAIERLRETALDALEIGEDAVTPLGLQVAELLAEEGIEILHQAATAWVLSQAWVSAKAL